MDDNERAEFARQEAARQAEAVFRGHEKYCPNCSGPTPSGGLCPSCQVTLAEGPRDSGGRVNESTPFTDYNNFLDNWNSFFDGDDKGYMDADSSSLDASTLNAERVCPNCCGPSPTGGYCPSCLVVLAADDRGSPGEPAGSLAGIDDSPGGLPTTEHSDLADPSSGDQKVSMPPDHHIYPRQFRDEFEAAKVDIDQYVVTLHQFQHDIIHSEGWNADWGMFFESAKLGGEDPTFEDVLDFGRYMIEKYELGEAIVHAYKDQSGELGPHMLP